MANEWIFEHLAAIALEDGDLRPLVARVRMRKTLTEDEWKVVEQVLEAAAAGRKGWRLPKRPPFSERKVRHIAYGVLYHYYHFRLAYGTGGQSVEVRTHEEAVRLVGAEAVRLVGAKRGESWVNTFLGIARSDPLIMGDATIKAMVEAFERSVTKEDWEAEQARRNG